MDKEKHVDDTLVPLPSQQQGTVLSSSEGGTKRNIKSRHAQMIAIGGTIGTGLFVGSGQALAIGGPLFLFLAYCIISILVYGVVTAVVEIGTFLPISGGTIPYYTSRFVSPSLAFALGWLYFYSFAIIVAYEVTAAAIVIDYWPNNVPIAAWITIMLFVIVALNFCPVGAYAETEFWFAGIKVIMITGLLLLSFILMVGGGPNHQVLGFHYWKDPGAINAYLLAGARGKFTAFLYVVVFSGFSFYFGPELLLFTAAEMRDPRKNLPIAARRFFWRLIVFYVVGALAIGIICASNAINLTSGSGDAKSSPWVIAIQNAGIPVLPSIINVGILTSAWSSGNSYLYMSSRALYTLAQTGNAPKIFAKCTRYGLPIYSVIASSLFALLAYLSVGSEASTVFNYLISLTNTAGFTSWIVCCAVYLRFRKACKAQGIVVPYTSRVQPYASWICIAVFTVLLLCNGFTVFYPGQFTVAGFLVTYLGIPIFLLLWFGHKLVRDRSSPWALAPLDVDLTTHVREVEAEAEAWAEMDAASKDNNSGKWYSKLDILWG